MFTVIPVRFRYILHDLWFDPADTGGKKGDRLICRTERGLEIGSATSDAISVTEAQLKETIRDAELKPVLRIASEDDLCTAEALAERSEALMPHFREYVKTLDLSMKPVGVDLLFDGEKAIFYFTADDRVDFRELVRLLARDLHMRIDMRQIGSREQAALTGGFGGCGQELCCRRSNCFSEPVSIRMAKEQDLALNSAKISGVCGRLMCCLRYELDAYKDFKQRAPKRNATITTDVGNGKVCGFNTPKEEVNIRLEIGKEIHIPLAGMYASAEAQQRAETQGCPLRPDSVSRSALEHLQSPEVQMALEELDRKSGKYEEQIFDAEDLFVRKRKSGEKRAADASEVAGAGTRGAQAGSVVAGSASPAPSRKSRPAASASSGSLSRSQKRTKDARGSHGEQSLRESVKRGKKDVVREKRQDGGASAQKRSKQAKVPGEKTKAVRTRTRHPGDRSNEALGFSSSAGVDVTSSVSVRKLASEDAQQSRESERARKEKRPSRTRGRKRNREGDV